MKQYNLGDYIEFEGKKRKIGITSHGYLFFYGAINKKKHLHIYFWEQANGKHPGKGWHIHHKDENKFNNEISNLELLKLGEHVSKHKNQGGCVYFHKHKDKWVFAFYENKKQKFKYFVTKSEAEYAKENYNRGFSSKNGE